MRVGVVGATGQIGNAIAMRLHQSGRFQVTAVKRKKSKLAFPSGIKTFEIGEMSAGSIDQFLDAIDHVVYAIGCPEKWVRDQSYFKHVNVELLKRFLEQLNFHPDVSLTYISTFEVFSDLEGVITEDRPLSETAATPYYGSMLEAMGLVRNFERESGARICCFHPSAVFGGLNTGLGLTNYLLNLRDGRYWRVPAVPPGRFPLIHVESLAKAVELQISSGLQGHSFLVSDGEASLHDLGILARAAISQAYVPMEVPLPLVNAAVSAMEFASWFTKSPPLISRVQVKYVAQGLSVDCAKARKVLGWRSMPLEEGIASLFSSVGNLTVRKSIS